MPESNALNREQKLDLLQRISGDADRFFQDYTDELAALIKDPDQTIRAKAVLCLWEYPTKYFLAELFNLADNGDPQVRHNAIKVLGRYVYENSIEDFDLDVDQKLNLQDDVSHEDYQKVTDFLLGIYHSRERTPDDRRFALEALSFSDRDEIAALIEEAYQAGDTDFKISAIFAMGRNANAKWEPVLIKELDSDNPAVQREAVKAVGECGLERAGAKLTELTYSKDKSIQIEAIWALGQTGYRGAFERLLALSESRDQEILEIANEALEEWHTYSYNEENEDDFSGDS